MIEVTLFRSLKLNRSLTALLYRRRDFGSTPHMLFFGRVDDRRWYIIFRLFGFGVNVYWDSGIFGRMP